MLIRLQVNNARRNWNGDGDHKTILLPELFRCVEGLFELSRCRRQIPRHGESEASQVHPVKQERSASKCEAKFQRVPHIMRIQPVDHDSDS
jgi:hypothetical protein